MTGRLDERLRSGAAAGVERAAFVKAKPDVDDRESRRDALPRALGREGKPRAGCFVAPRLL
jgi:hypothetical protein